MPRQLDKLPRWGYSYLLDTPRCDTGEPKKYAKTWHDGTMSYMPRRKGRLPLKGEPPVPRYTASVLGKPDFKRKSRPDVLKYQVSCTICLDQGCDRCPQLMEE